MPKLVPKQETLPFELKRWREDDEKDFHAWWLGINGVCHLPPVEKIGRVFRGVNSHTPFRDLSGDEHHCVFQIPKDLTKKDLDSFLNALKKHVDYH